MKKIEELRVGDLRAELDKRKLDKSGVKLSHGEDAKQFEFSNVNPSICKRKVQDPSAEPLTSNKDVLVEHLLKESLSTDRGMERVANRKSFTKCSPMKQIVKAEEKEVVIKEEEQHDPENETHRSNEDGVKMCKQEMNGTASKEAKDKDESVEGIKDHEEEGRENGLMKEEYARHIKIDSFNLMIEDENNMLDYEENDCTDMEELSNADGKGKEDGNNDLAGNSPLSASKQDSSGLITNKHQKDNNKSGKDTDPNASKDEKKDGNPCKASSSRNLWVIGLGLKTQAKDLKTLFLKHGKVVSAKIVTKSKTPGGKCFGFVTMSTLDDAKKCFKHINRTELHGRMIRVEMAKGELGGPKSSSIASKSNGQCSNAVPTSDKKEREKSGEAARKDRDYKGKETRTRNPVNGEEKGKESRSNDREKERPYLNDTRSRLARHSDKTRVVDRLHEIDKRRSFPPNDNPAGAPPRSPTNRTVHERERHLRIVEEKRGERQMRIIEKRQKEAAEELYKERMKLQREREEIERQRQDLLRLEREKFERERDELKKLRIKYEDVGRGLKRRLPPSDKDRRDYFDDQKTVPYRGVPNRSIHNREPDRMPERGGSNRENMLRRSVGGGGRLNVVDRVVERVSLKEPYRGSVRGRFNDDESDSRYEHHGTERRRSPIRGANRYDDERRDRRPMDRVSPRREGRDHRGPLQSASMRDRQVRNDRYNEGPMINVPLDSSWGAGNSSHKFKNGGSDYGSGNSNFMAGGSIPGRAGDGQTSWHKFSDMGGGRNNSMVDILRNPESFFDAEPISANHLPLIPNMNRGNRFRAMDNFRK